MKWEKKQSGVFISFGARVATTRLARIYGYCHKAKIADHARNDENGVQCYSIFFFKFVSEPCRKCRGLTII